MNTEACMLLFILSVFNFFELCVLKKYSWHEKNFLLQTKKRENEELLLVFGFFSTLFLENRKKDIQCFKCCEVIFLTASNQETVKGLLLHPIFWNKVKTDKLIYEGSTVDKAQNYLHRICAW